MATRLPILSVLSATLAAACGYPEFAFVSDAAIPDVQTLDADAEAEAGPDAAPTARTWLFDFGARTDPTPGYNNLDQSLAGGGTLSNLLDTDGATSGLAIRIDAMESFDPDGANGNGTTAPGASVPFASTATRDSFYGSTSAFMGSTTPRARVELTGLDPDASYELEIFASRMMGAGVLESAYTIGTTTLYLDANDNTSRTVTFTSLRPSSTGTLTMTVTKGPLNTSMYGFYYLGAMRLSTSPP